MNVYPLDLDFFNVINNSEIGNLKFIPSLYMG